MIFSAHDLPIRETAARRMSLLPLLARHGASVLPETIAPFRLSFPERYPSGESSRFRMPALTFEGERIAHAGFRNRSAFVLLREGLPESAQRAAVRRMIGLADAARALYFEVQDRMVAMLDVMEAAIGSGEEREARVRGRFNLPIIHNAMRRQLPAFGLDCDFGKAGGKAERAWVTLRDEDANLTAEAFVLSWADGKLTAHQRMTSFAYGNFDKACVSVLGWDNKITPRLMSLGDVRRVAATVHQGFAADEYSTAERAELLARLDDAATGASPTPRLSDALRGRDSGKGSARGPLIAIPVPGTAFSIMPAGGWTVLILHEGRAFLRAPISEHAARPAEAALGLTASPSLMGPAVGLLSVLAQKPAIAHQGDPAAPADRWEDRLETAVRSTDFGYG